MKYTTLFDCYIFHDYFQSRKCPAINVVPSAWTNRIFRSYNLKYSYTSNRLQVSMPNIQDQKNLLEEEPSPIRLLFYVEISDALFLNYSNLSLENINQKIYYFNNHHTKENQLTNKDFVSSEDRIDCQPKQFSLNVDQSQEATFLVKDMSEKVIDEVNIKEDQKEIRIDLFQDPDDVYKIDMSDAKESFKFYAGNIHPFGIIAIDINPQDWFKTQPYQPKSYQITFENRSTYWRYNIINNEEFPLEGFSITSSNNEITFIKEDDRVLNNGTKSATLVSNQSIPLKENQQEKLNLHMNKKMEGGYNNLTKVIPLSKASINQIKPIQNENEQRVISDIYIYL